MTNQNDPTPVSTCCNKAGTRARKNTNGHKSRRQAQRKAKNIPRANFPQGQISKTSTRGKSSFRRVKDFYDKFRSYFMKFAVVALFISVYKKIACWIPILTRINSALSGWLSSKGHTISIPESDTAQPDRGDRGNPPSRGEPMDVDYRDYLHIWAKMAHQTRLRGYILLLDVNERKMAEATSSRKNGTLSRKNFTKVEGFFRKMKKFFKSGSIPEIARFSNLPKPPLWSLQRNSLVNTERMGEMLSTAEVDTGMAMCRKLQRGLDGLNGELPYSFPLLYPAYTPQGKFVQIITIRKHHSICVSNVFSPDNNSVAVYDSEIGTDLYCDAMEPCQQSQNSNSGSFAMYGVEDLARILRLLRPDGETVRISYAKVQQQSRNSNNCGLFAIINAAAICQNIRPESFVVNEPRLRRFMADAFRSGQLSELKDFIEMRREVPTVFYELEVALYPPTNEDCVRRMTTFEQLSKSF